MHDTVILIPAHNESASIGTVIREVRQHCDFPVIVIDDASNDGTAETARQAGAKVLELAAHLGAWGAIQTGIRHALQEGFEHAITMDADGQHEAAFLDVLLEPVRLQRADVSIGAFTRRGSGSRQIAWFLLRRISGLKMEDITSGFRAYNRTAMGLLKRKRATLLEYQDIGVLALLCRNRLRLVEVPVNMRLRTDGPSRVYSSWMMVAYYMAYSLVLGFSKRCTLTTPPPPGLRE